MGINANVSMQGGGGGSPASDRWYSDEAFAIAAVPIGSGTVYYVDAARPNDTGDGLSEGAAKKTIQAALDLLPSSAPGATVRIKAGRYHEQLSITNKSGSSGSPIAIGAYGDGEVIIDGSEQPSWSLYSGSIYQATLSEYGSGSDDESGRGIQAVVVDGVLCYPPTTYSRSALVSDATAGRYFFDTSTHVIYVWCPDGTSPASHDTVLVQASFYNHYGIRLTGCNYVTFYGVTIRAFQKGYECRGPSTSGYADHCKVELCRICYCIKEGVAWWGYNGTVRYLDILRNDIHDNVMMNFPRSNAWGGWSSSCGSGGSEDTTIQGNWIHDNGGEGTLIYASTGSTTRLSWLDNIVWDNYSVGIYTDNNAKVTIARNFVYCTTPDTGLMTNCGYTVASPGSNGEYYRIARRLRQEGIVVGGENYGGGFNGDDIIIENNIIVACRRNIHGFGEVTGYKFSNVKIRGNTSIVADNPQTFESEANGGGRSNFVGINVPYDTSYPNVGTDIRNNLVYASHADTWTVWSEGPASPDYFLGLTIDHNLIYHSGKASDMHWGPSWTSGYDMSHTTWLALSGASHGSGDVTSNPNLVDATDHDSAASARTQSGSPARNAGADLSMTEDWNETARDATPTIGAWED